MKKFMLRALVTGLLVVSTVVGATSYTGLVGTLRYSLGANPRVGVPTSQVTACSVPGWYGVENADVGIGMLQAAALMSAQARGRNVVIVGTGTCDAYNVESIRYIDVQ